MFWWASSRGVRVAGAIRSWRGVRGCSSDGGGAKKGLDILHTQIKVSLSWERGTWSSNQSTPLVCRSHHCGRVHATMSPPPCIRKYRHVTLPLMHVQSSHTCMPSGLLHAGRRVWSAGRLHHVARDQPGVWRGECCLTGSSV